MTMYTIKPSQVEKHVVKCMQTGIVPYLSSSPGMGKSSIFRAIAKKYNLKVIDLRLSMCTPEDLMGLPMRNGNRASFATFEMFPTVDDKIPEGYSGWLLLLDEFPSAAKAVQAASYKIVLDRMVGQEYLHENVFIVAAGNLTTDKAIVNQMGTAMQSRLVHFEMQSDHKEFMQFAAAAGYDHRILGFLDFQPAKLHDFNPNHQDHTFACPRTWEFVSKMIKDEPFEEITMPMLAGAISDGVATEFYAFLKQYGKLPSFSSICGDPENINVPSEAGTQYALLSMITEKMEHKLLDNVTKYIARFPPEFQVIFWRGLVRKDMTYKDHPLYSKKTSHLVRFMYDDEATLAA